MPRHSSMATEGSLKTNKAPEKAGQMGTRGTGRGGGPEREIPPLQVRERGGCKLSSQDGGHGTRMWLLHFSL